MDRTCTKLICTPCRSKIHVFILVSLIQNHSSMLPTHNPARISAIYDHAVRTPDKRSHFCFFLGLDVQQPPLCTSTHCAHSYLPLSLNQQILQWQRFWVTFSTSCYISLEVPKFPGAIWTVVTSYWVWIWGPCLCFCSVLDLQVLSPHRLLHLDDALSGRAVGLAKIRSRWHRC